MTVPRALILGLNFYGTGVVMIRLYRKKKAHNFDKRRSYGLFGASGDTELFEKPSNINGFGLSDNFFSCIAS